MHASSKVIGRALCFANALRIFEEFRIVTRLAAGKRQPSDHGPFSRSLFTELGEEPFLTAFIYWATGEGGRKTFQV